ncbi:LuxR C-terminal-related transcriptional regulator [Azospirillum oleiclasticum]|uniref:LuxR C-terminal-related transcriptional regulator n=1 Tax=Azospirillum oleiclasticum TaxID=2735135 RepID=UPI0018AD3F7E|nr:response regulator transcription factor [Azospirillum oleiclasticum]
MHNQPPTHPDAILVVDDHALVRHGLALVIKANRPDIAVHEAGTLAEGLRVARSAGNLSAVLYDLTLADSSGLPGLTAMMKAVGRTPVIVVSGQTDSNTMSQCIMAGARGYLPKGSQADVLDHALALVLAGGIYAPAIPASNVGDPQPYAILGELTSRQRDVLRLLMAGRSNKEIARALGVLEGTIKVHLRSIMMKLKVRNRTHLAIVAAQAGVSAD